MKHRTGILWGSLLLGIFLGTWAGLALATEAEGGRYRLRVNGISCPFCAYGVEKKLGALDGVETVAIRLDEGAVIVRTRPGAELTEKRARGALKAAGFGLQGFEVLAPATPAREIENQ